MAWCSLWQMLGSNGKISDEWINEWTNKDYLNEWTKLCSRKLSSPHYKLLYLEVPSVSLSTFLYQGRIHSHQHRFVSRNIPGLLESVCKLGDWLLWGKRPLLDVLGLLCSYKFLPALLGRPECILHGLPFCNPYAAFSLDFGCPFDSPEQKPLQESPFPFCPLKSGRDQIICCSPVVRPEA